MAVLSASPAVVFGPSHRRGGLRIRVSATPVTALVAAVALAFLVTLSISVFAGPPVVSASSAPVSPASVETAAFPAWTVQAGDTLWTIAQTTRPQADPRAVVLQIQVLNGMTAGHVLQAGEVLQLPRS